MLNLLISRRQRQILALGSTLLCAACITTSAGQPLATTDLRLVPFPKELQLEPGDFPLHGRLVLEVSGDQEKIIGDQLSAELKLAGFEAPTVRALGGAANVLRLTKEIGGTSPELKYREAANPEDYILQIRSSGVVVVAPGKSGLFYGAQTLRQLLRANRRGQSLPGLTIRDWPSIGWRAFQDDLTRGPCSSLDEIKREAALGAFLKQNIFTYYMEYQYEFAKHPKIGPPDGSLTPEELKSLVKFAQPLHLNILGNQQSFGHFTHILRHPEYAPLRETAYLLCPTNEATYRLLDDLYSEVCPLLPFPFFNVCCDETEGLGTGPSKPVAEKIGVGALYVGHINRVHDLIKNKYGKRMMMWGDIILNHPEHLEKIPKDTVMLTWGYDPRPSFEHQIIPFAKSGYEFFVCPGVNNWSRVLPNFSASMTNIRNFVRDGLKHGATGVLTTAWDDDGENFNAPSWHGVAWGAECAWTGSATDPADFNRRLGAVLFGEKGDHFGQAIAQLSKPGIDGVFNHQFWRFKFEPIKSSDATAKRSDREGNLTSIRSAIQHLDSCRKDATLNGEMLDFFLFGARRLELFFQRELNRDAAASAYAKATRSAGEEAASLLQEAMTLLRRDRDAYKALGGQFAELWCRENKPYALDWTLHRYAEAVKGYDAVLSRLEGARTACGQGRSIPPAEEIGLKRID